MVQWVASRPGALGQSYWTQQVLKNKKQTGRGEGVCWKVWWGLGSRYVKIHCIHE